MSIVTKLRSEWTKEYLPSQTELEELTNYLNKKYFNDNISCGVYYNGSLRTTGGRFEHWEDVSQGDYNIFINDSYVRHFGLDEMIDTIKHELIHYNLFLDNGSSGCGHNSKFKTIMENIGCSMYAKPFRPVKIHTYKCKECGYSITRKRRFDVFFYRCGNCGGDWEYIKTEVKHFK